MWNKSITFVQVQLKIVYHFSIVMQQTHTNPVRYIHECEFSFDSIGLKIGGSVLHPKEKWL